MSERDVRDAAAHVRPPRSPGHMGGGNSGLVANARRLDASRRAADVLRTAIKAGQVRGQLPDESALAAAYGVSRNAIRESLETLASEGLVRRQRGRGSFVVVNASQHELRFLHGLEESQRDGSRRVGHQVLLATQIDAPARLAEVIGVPPGAPIVLIERLTTLDGNPVALRTSYLPFDVGRRLLESDLTLNLYDLLEQRAGLRLEGASIRVDTVVSDQLTSGRLLVPVAAPLLLVQGTVFAEGGRVVDLHYIRVRADAVTFSYASQRVPEGL